MAKGFAESFESSFVPSFQRSREQALQKLREIEVQKANEIKFKNRINELRENGLIFETPEAVGLKINDLKGQGIDATAKFDPNLRAFILDTTKPGQFKKPTRALLPTLDDVKREAQGNLFEAEYLEDQETGETGFAFKIKKSEGVTTENTKELNSRLNKLSNLGGDISREELNSFPNMLDKLDFVNTKIAGTISEKKTASQEKRDVEDFKLKKETNSLIDLFKTAIGEAKKANEGIGKSGLGGRIAGKVITGEASLLGESVRGKTLANVNAYNISLKAFATVAAKAAGEIRPTNEDIIRFSATLPRFTLSDAENDILIEQLRKKTRNNESLANSWLEATGKKIEKIQTENTFKQNIPIDDIKPTNTIIVTNKGKFEFVGYDEKTGKKKYKRLK